MTNFKKTNKQKHSRQGGENADNFVISLYIFAHVWYLPSCGNNVILFVLHTLLEHNWLFNSKNIFYCGKKMENSKIC